LVKANPYLLKIALKNIIDNACKYSDKEVNVALYREQQQVILEVEDQGIGIRKKNRAYFPVFLSG
jgi:signal transduction histidine kinase